MFRKLWTQRYTADEYFGFALTGNSFMQKSEKEQQMACQELVLLADKHNGVVSTYTFYIYLKNIVTYIKSKAKLTFYFMRLKMDIIIRKQTPILAEYARFLT